ncbi:hypothetical protein N7451_008630 [Penicillium sp. IBT 35674x]|nr:hypothetical protein N7451_008630 [Penicillium sp. IBT 35674x]
MASDLTQSESIQSTHPGLDEQDSSHLYIIYRKRWKRHYEVKSAAGQLLYFGEVSSFKHAKPDLTLHRGSADAPVVAASKLLKLSGDFKLALGDPDDVNNVQWEDMTRESWMHQTYRFEVNTSSQSRDTHGQRRALLWKRTRSVGVDGSSPSWNSRNFKLVDELSGDLVAVFTSKRSIGQCGRLQIKEEHGQWFDTLVLLSYLSLYERFERHNRQAAAAAGGS